MTLDHSFFGAWRLASSKVELSEGTAPPPFGAEASGLIVWSSDGAFSAQISPGPAPDGTEWPYIAYFGTWDYDEAAGEVVHTVDASVNANLRGTVQRRGVTFDGDRVTLRPPPTETDGVTRSMSIIWEREQRPDSAS